MVSKPMAQCKRCKNVIYWVHTVGGKNIPCDPAVTTGPVVMTEEGRFVTDGVTEGRVAHWATCPNASEFRKPKKSKSTKPTTLVKVDGRTT